MLFSPFFSVNGIRRKSGKVKKTFAAKRIIVSQGEEVEKFRKFFAAKRIIVSQGT